MADRRAFGTQHCNLSVLSKIFLNLALGLSEVIRDCSKHEMIDPRKSLRQDFLGKILVDVVVD